jgi:hypothetical protein
MTDKNSEINDKIKLKFTNWVESNNANMFLSWILGWLKIVLGFNLKQTKQISITSQEQQSFNPYLISSTS